MWPAIDPAVEPSGYIDPTEPSHSFAPSSLSFNPRLASKGLKNLHLHRPGWRRRNYFFELFSKLAPARLSPSENAKFLERFRYIIVASQLLSQHINFSHYNYSSGNLLPPHQQQQQQLAADDDSDSTPFFGPPFANIRFWAGNSLCMGIITLILGWFLRWGDRQKGAPLSQGRTGLGLLGLTMAGVILFTNVRRRWLRRLRGRTIELATQFVENSQAYDILASNAITFIQEVQLISRGYRLSTPLPPISRIDRDSHMRRCARLRRSVSASLDLAMAPYSQAFQTLRPLVQESDLDKYYDIYDVRNADIEYLTLGGSTREAEFEDMESLEALKALLHRLHTTRKVFLCCLLALDANGGYSDFSTWGTVVEQLKVLSALMGEIAESLQQHSEEESQFRCPPTPSTTRPNTSHATSPTRERWRGQVRKLNSLSQALRGLQAKMQILREDSDKSLQDESMDLVEFGPDLLAHYDSIGSDLQALMQEWESGRTLLVMSIDKQGGNSNRSSLSLGSGIGWNQTQSLDGATPRNSWGVVSPTGEGTDALFPLREKMGELVEGNEGGGEEVDEGKTEMIYEGVGDVGKPRPRSNLSREERIRRVQEERVRLAEERKKQVEQGNLVKELQSVLGNRPSIPQKRVPVRSASS